MKEIKKLVAKARKDNEIIAVILFGSRARGDAKKDSDIDICLMLKSKNAVKKRIQYSFSDKLDVHLFHALPMYIKMEILKEGKILLCKDESALYGAALSTVRAFEDYKKFYYGYLEAMKNEQG